MSCEGRTRSSVGGDWKEGRKALSLSGFVGALKRGVLAFHKETTFSAKATLFGFLVLICVIVIGIISAEYEHAAKPVVRQSEGQSRGIDPALLAMAQAGDAAAQSSLGVDYEFGKGVPQDYTQAAAWYRKAADQGDAKAQSNLGNLYYDGHGVPQDYAQGAVWLRKAAEHGNALAQYNLGVLYEHGRGVPQDYTQAAVWYRKAAEQGYASAQYNLGVFYEHGLGLPRDYTQAAAWYRKAAEQGHAKAKGNLEILNEQQGENPLSDMIGWFDEQGWIGHNHDTPVWIKGDWIVGEYRNCGMRTTTPPVGIVLSQEAQAELPRLFCGKNWKGEGVSEFEIAMPDPAAATNAIFGQGDWSALDSNFHILPVRYHGRIDRPDAVFVSWRCQRLSESLECKAPD